MRETRSTTIPLLPCEALDATLEFWQALGFATGYRQRAPNPYATMYYDDFELHFFGLKQLNPQDNFTTCLVIVAEVEELHETFAARLRAALGKIPAKGFPRISRMRPGQTRFTVTDNAGNSVIFIRRGGEDSAAADAYKQPGQTPLERALNLAARLRDFKNDDATAARTLDLALSRAEPQPSLDYARVLAARLELAIARDEHSRALELREQLRALDLPAEERAALSAEYILPDL